MKSICTLFNLLPLCLLCLFAMGIGTSASAKTFKTPELAVEALAAAADSKNLAAMEEILGGEESRDILFSGDEVDDENGRDAFAALYKKKHSIEIKEDGTKAVLVVGDDEWPFPVPLIRKDGAWAFDAAEGKQEILYRRVGRNELSTMEVCRAYVDAQNEYAQIMREQNGVSSYAQKFKSSPGKKDGLYWPDEEGGQPSPLGELAAIASNEGYVKKDDKPVPYHGYYYKILTSQGPSAPNGSLDYIANGRMIGGFGLVAWPAEYGNSGVMTFIINQEGTIYQKDLGVDTGKYAAAMKSFDPDASWEKEL